MAFSLASAEVTDLSGSGWWIVLIDLGVIAAVAVLALVPMVVARTRFHPRTEGIIAGAFLWGLVTAGSMTYTAITQYQWLRERSLLIKTGYYEPQNDPGAPAWPWGLWVMGLVGYGVLVGYSLSSKKSAGPPPEKG